MAFTPTEDFSVNLPEELNLWGARVTKRILSNFDRLKINKDADESKGLTGDLYRSIYWTVHNASEFAAVSAQQQIQMEEMRMTMAATAAALAALTQRLDQPINATVNRYGRGGSLEAERKAQRWESRNRV